MWYNVRMTKQIVQLDNMDDPYNDRGTAVGNKRLPLNNEERSIINRREMANRILDMMIEKVDMKDIAQELDVELVDLVNDYAYSTDFPALREKLSERIADQFLDTRRGHTVSEIMEETGLTEHRFWSLVNSEEFQEIYNKKFHNLSDSPVIRAIQSGIVNELLPQAYITLSYLLQNSESDNVRYKVAKDILSLAGVRAVETRETSRHDAAKFLADRKIEVTVNVPPEYREAMDNVIEVEPVSDSRLALDTEIPHDE